jgi:hypothetical protein
MTHAMRKRIFVCHNQSDNQRVKKRRFSDAPALFAQCGDVSRDTDFARRYHKR